VAVSGSYSIVGNPVAFSWTRTWLPEGQMPSVSLVEEVGAGSVSISREAGTSPAPLATDPVLASLSLTRDAAPPFAALTKE
jgi:hypothetical protein